MILTEIKLASLIGHLQQATTLNLPKKNNEVSFIAPDVEEDVELNINLIVKDPLGLSAEANHKVTIFNLFASL